MRYWLHGEDENYERERERVSRFGGALPAPMSSSHVMAVVALVGIHATVFTSSIVALVLWFR